MHIFRWHSSLKAASHGPAVRNMPIHLQQSTLDGACGPHCAYMALLLLGIIRRDDLDGLPRSRQRRLSSMWKQTERRYFVGSHAGHLQSALKPYARDLSCSIRRSNCIATILAVLDDAGVGIVQIGNDEFNHWVLAVGIGGTELNPTRRGNRDFNPMQLLILDPTFAAIPLSPWNGLLSVRPGRQAHHIYDTPDGRLHVRIACVLTLRKVDHGSR